MPFDSTPGLWPEPPPKPEPIPGLFSTYVEAIQAVGFLAIASGTCWWVVLRWVVR